MDDEEHERLDKVRGSLPGWLAEGVDGQRAAQLAGPVHLAPHAPAVAGC